MNKVKYIIMVLAFPAFLSCAPRAVGSKTGTVNEDLSKYRPSIGPELQKELALDEKVEKANIYVRPENDITSKLNSVLDSLELKAGGQKTILGYTIQVYSGNNREVANDAKSLVYRLFPDSRPETTYVQPNYKVKVGKYLTRSEAQKLFAKLKNDFPGALVIPEKISLARY